MKRHILVAAGGLLLATANTPPTTSAPAPEGELTSVVAAEAPAAVAARPAKPAKPARTAAADPAGDYPHCSASVRDRCAQGHYRAARARHREVQYAMRAGERG
jgi:hypothetical protein